MIADRNFLSLIYPVDLFDDLTSGILQFAVVAVQCSFSFSNHGVVRSFPIFWPPFTNTSFLTFLSWSWFYNVSEKLRTFLEMANEKIDSACVTNYGQHFLTDAQLFKISTSAPRFNLLCLLLHCSGHHSLLFLDRIWAGRCEHGDFRLSDSATRNDAGCIIPHTSEIKRKAALNKRYGVARGNL